MNGSGPITRRGFIGAALLAGLGGNAFAQGFAGLGESADGFAAVVPGRTFAFPADHGPHPEFRIEWWYVTAISPTRVGRPTARNGRCFARRSRRVARRRAGPTSRYGWAMPPSP